LANFFVATSKKILAPGPISPAEAKADANLFNVFALFPFALKDINQIDVRNAATLLDEFTKSQPIGRFAWIAELKPLAQKYLDDCKVYLDWKAQPGALPPDKKQLKTRSAITDAVLGKTVAAPPIAAEPSAPARQLNQKELR